MSLKDPKKKREYNRKWAADAYKKDPARYRDYRRERYNSNPGFRTAARSASNSWKARNPQNRRFHEAKRRARKYAAAGFSYTTQDHVRARIAFFGGKCAYCGTRGYEHIDHAIPLSRGGSHWPSNLRPACSKCNLKKHDKTWSSVVL